MKTVFKYIIPAIIFIAFFVLAITEKADLNSGNYLNFGLTLLTYFYVVFTWEMLERMKMESYLERRPYIVADFKSPKGDLHFELENIGKTPALNVKVKVTPDFELGKKEETINSTIFNDKIDFYPPKKMIETYISSTSSFFDKNPDKFMVQLDYEDCFKMKFSEKIILDLNHHKKQSYLIEKDLKDVVKSIDDLKKIIEKK
ncbi:MAG: hypothetical protein KKC03_00455 [Bacteroidetes bacterium]|nr:hypothetical protein [Bacteroidota bacterium]